MNLTELIDRWSNLYYNTMSMGEYFEDFENIDDLMNYANP